MKSARDAKQTTRERILQEAEALMLLNGFNGTSIDDICNKVQITKGGFFHHFANKEALGSELLHNYWRGTVESLINSKAMAYKDPFKRLMAMVDFFESIFEVPKRPRACLLGNITQEVALTNDSIRSTCQDIFEQWLVALETVIKEVITVRKIKQKVDVKGLALLIVATVEGAFTMVKASDDLETIKRTFKHLRNYLTLLLAKNE